MISRSRRDSVGGGSSRIFPCSPGADQIFGGGGGRSRNFQRNQMFTPYSVVIFIGRDTHFAKYDKRLDFLRKNNRSIKLPQFREVFYNSGRPGDQAPFLETPGNSGRLGRSVNPICMSNYYLFSHAIQYNFYTLKRRSCELIIVNT